MKTQNLIVTLLIILIAITAYSQETSNKQEKKNGIAQFTFCYPVGTAGVRSMDYSNHFSINIIAGLNGGVNGFEAGSVLNINTGSVFGGQFAGVANINLKGSKGGVFAGVSNVSYGNTAGITAAGVANITVGDATGASLAGVANVAHNSNGLQASVVNLAVGNMTGGQLGIINIARNVGNSETNEKGFQLGIINIADTVTGGVPIGLFNIVRTGYFAIELSASEVLYGNLAFKFGTRKFYTTLNGGLTSFKGIAYFSTGLGFGSIVDIADKQSIAVEAVSYNLIYNNDWDGRINMLNQLKFSYQYNFTDNLALSVAPVINSYITGVQVDGEYGTINMPYSAYSKQGKKVKHSMWFGINAGAILTF